MTKVVGPDDMKRIISVSEAMEAADRRADQARDRWRVHRDDASLEAWKQELLDQEAAHKQYWEVTGEYIERLGP